VHIEIDVVEIIVLIFFYTLFKWLFRGIIIVVVIKAINLVKKKGLEQIEGIKNQFNSKNDNKGDLED
jgi:hypothetical protein